jgi:RNA polymerase sigma-70 factor (ECF subfamily)
VLKLEVGCRWGFFLATLQEQDAEDVKRSLAGDADGYARIVRRYQVDIERRLRSFARSAEDTQELTQEVFVEAYASLPTFTGKGSLSAWLQQITTRVGYRYWRRLASRKETDRDDDWWRTLIRPDPEQIDPASARQLVFSLLEQLTPRDRLVLLLVHIEERSVEETAKLTGWSKTMVKVQAFRARRRLKAILTQAGIVDLQSALEFEPKEAGDYNHE